MGIKERVTPSDLYRGKNSKEQEKVRVRTPTHMKINDGI